MLQPFELLKQVYLDRLKKMNKKYLVSQSYTRAFNHFAEKHKIDILVTDYDDLNYARVHFNAVKNDQYASIIYLENEQHSAKLFEMVKGEKYAVYWAIVRSGKELQDRIEKKYKDNVRRYIQQNTTWRISGDSAISPKLEVIFGELFLILKHGSQVLRVKFEEIEKA